MSLSWRTPPLRPAHRCPAPASPAEAVARARSAAANRGAAVQYAGDRYSRAPGPAGTVPVAGPAPPGIPAVARTRRRPGGRWRKSRPPTLPRTADAPGSTADGQQKDRRWRERPTVAGEADGAATVNEPRKPSRKANECESRQAATANESEPTSRNSQRVGEPTSRDRPTVRRAADGCPAKLTMPGKGRGSPGADGAGGGTMAAVARA
jgi:hypothetical protein